MDFSNIIRVIMDLVSGGKRLQSGNKGYAIRELTRAAESAVKTVKKIKEERAASRNDLTDCGPKATEADLAELEKDLDASLPSDYRAFLLKTNGGKLPHNRFDYTNFEGEAVFSYVDVFLSVKHSDLERNIFTVSESYHNDERVPVSVIPIAKDTNGSLVCLSISYETPGSIWFWDTELEDALFDEENLNPLAANFTAFLAGLKADS